MGLILCLISCKETNNSTFPDVLPDITKNISLRYVSKDYAADACLAFANITQNSNPFRSATPLRVQRIRSIGETLLRSGDPIADSTLYFVDFAERQGYAIYAADKRINKVYALMDTGNSDEFIEDYRNAVAHNTEEGHLLSLINNDIKSKLDSLDYIGDQKYIVSFADTALHIEEYIPNKLKTNWDQYKPYNIIVNQYGGQDVLLRNSVDEKGIPVGCVTVAVAQIVAHFKAIEYYKELNANNIYYRFLWDEIIKECQKNKGRLGENANPSIIHQVGMLMSGLCKELHVDLSSEGSGTTDKAALTYMRSIGLSVPQDMSKFTELDVKNILKKDGIAYMGGYHKEIFWGTWGAGSGHSWLSDGFLSVGMWCQGEAPIYDPNCDRNEDDCRPIDWEKYCFYDISNYIHINWGWNKDYNGYFCGDLFDYFNPKFPDFYSTNSTSPTDKDHQYKHLRMTGVYKK